MLEELTAQGRKVVPLAYVNTDLALKAVVGEYGGAVCTSANAATMLRWALDQGDSVLFLPDRHLGDNTATGLGIAPADRHVLRIGSKGLVAPDTQALDRKLLRPLRAAGHPGYARRPPRLPGHCPPRMP